MMQPEQQVADASWGKRDTSRTDLLAGSRASANTHTGVYYIRNVCGEDLGTFATLLQVEEMKMRAEERSEEVT
jgi:hypothetical protein